ncbi:MAG: plastocyanin/azurin family copper-binding protein [Actinomycetota bacterium]
MRTRVVWIVVAAMTSIPSLAFAAWSSSGSGTSSATRATTVDMGSTPSGTASGATVTLTWPASTLANGTAVTGYVIRRYDSAGSVELSIAAGTCSAIVAGTSCTHTSASEGTWRYSVTPAHNSWRGPESAKAPVTVDLTPPPVPSITANPPATNPSPNASFSFTDAESGVSYECKIDAGSFTACSNPKSYSSLVNGSHTFSVRALDAAGNPSTAATYTWTVQSCSQVTQTNFVFTPSGITIGVGCSVTWTQAGGTKHTTTSDTGVWDSGQMSNGATFTFQFTSPGTYPYKCTIHPASMTGTVTVT